MGRSIQIFKTFEEQELYFLKHFFELTHSGRLQALAELQKKAIQQPPEKKITLRKHFVHGY